MLRLSAYIAFLAIGLCMGAASPLLAQTTELSADEQASVKRLITSLADEEFDVRESATQSLIKFDKPALDLLTTALKETKDPEVAFRLRRILDAIEDGDPNPPREVLQAFLTAVKQGDADIVSQCLTERARREMARAGIHPLPPGSPKAEFELGEVRVSEQRRTAHIDSTWADKSQRYEITWVMRKEDRGWGVAGMSTRLFDDLEPITLSFEDPEGMRKVVADAEAEMARRSREAMP